MQDCNAVVYKNANTTGAIYANAIFETGTYGQGSGCQLIVTSEQGGSMIVVDSANQVLYGEDTPPHHEGPSWCPHRADAISLFLIGTILLSSPAAAGCPAAAVSTCMQCTCSAACCVAL